VNEWRSLQTEGAVGFKVQSSMFKVRSELKREPG
jgi:hypothetical protein